MTTSPDTPSSHYTVMEGELCALAHIAELLSVGQKLDETLTDILSILHNEANLLHGAVCLTDAEHSSVHIYAIHGDADVRTRATEHIRYRTGEGIIGSILQLGESVVLKKITQHPHFLNKLSLYNPELPFIGVPISLEDGSTIGVLTVQPGTVADESLNMQVRFVQSIAHILAQTLRLMLKVENRLRFTDEHHELRQETRAKYGFENMAIGHTTIMRKVFDQVRRVAKWNTTVLVLGESGTGKELIASAIHYNSPRAHQALIRLNCAALPENLLESELFGHEKGAFTGAIKTRKGRFEQADQGTLFLDEIGEVSPMFQAKLLRVLQEGELERVGGNQTIRINVRIVAATNRNLENEVEKGNFREDLYYRLNVMTIRIPPLRERITDLPELAGFLTDKIGRNQNRTLQLTDSALRLLMSYHWPGNVRELENSLERAAIMSENGTIDRESIILSGIDESQRTHNTPILPQFQSPSTDTLEDERERIIAALEQAGWVQAKAARLLDMTPRQIAYRIQTLNIQMRKI